MYNDLLVGTVVKVQKKTIVTDDNNINVFCNFQLRE